jgi:hypothetical protein
MVRVYDWGCRVRLCVVARSNEAVLTDAVMLCAECGCTLVPLTYILAADDDSRAGVGRPRIRCSCCGQRYEWHGSAGWKRAYALERSTVLVAGGRLS